jgi:hypothetical protein
MWRTSAGSCIDEVRCLMIWHVVDGTQADQGPSGGGSALLRPPWWWFHALVAVAAACLLWAFSVPGVFFLLGMGAAGVLALAGLIWAAWVLTIGLRRRTWSWWFVVAPVLGVIVLALLSAGVPLQSRWATSRSAFDTVVASLPPAADTGNERSPVTVPARIGSYDITMAYRVPAGVVFHEETGNVIDDAGFAYLPDGPKPDLENGSFESPVFRHLGGPWYGWTASW